jgi:hypothetical protein
VLNKIFHFSSSNHLSITGDYYLCCIDFEFKYLNYKNREHNIEFHYLKKTPRLAQSNLRHNKGPYLQWCGGSFAIVCVQRPVIQSDIYVFVFATITCAFAAQASCYLLHQKLSCHFFAGAIVSVSCDRWKNNSEIWSYGRPTSMSHTQQFHYCKRYEEKVEGNLWTWQTQPTIVCSMPDINQKYHFISLAVQKYKAIIIFFTYIPCILILSSLLFTNWCTNEMS